MNDEKGELKRDTLGKIAVALAKNEPETRNPIEITEELLTDYEKNFELCVREYAAKTELDHFFVVVITKKEPLFERVLRNYFLARRTCPTPDYDQIVYRFHTQSQVVNLLWVIPARDICRMLLDNASLAALDTPELLQCVENFRNGDLFKLAKRMNGEVSLESPLLDN